MPRIRTIKPELWGNEDIGQLSFGARLLFIGSWNFADDFGFIKANPVLLKSQIFPYDSTLRIEQVHKFIKELCDKKLLIPYIHDGNNYYIVPNFLKHQLIDKRYNRSYIGKENAEKALKNIKNM